jgi:hypothetical protein
MNSIDLNYGDGFPFENKTLSFMQDDYHTALNGLAALGGSGNFIISGLVQNGSNMSAGWIFYNGELIRFVDGVKEATFIIVEDVEQKIYQNGQTRDAYKIRYAKFGTGVSPINFTLLKRLPSLLEMQSLMTSIIDFETSIVVSGCVPSNISSAPTTLDLSAGLVMIDNNLLAVPGYSGVYPVWINADGQHVTAQPGAGSFIKFNPYTSQNKSSVIRRAVYRTGDVLMTTVLSDRFDNTGLGKWEMKGFARMNGANGTLDIRGRSPLAFDGRGADPAPLDPNSIWDANYQALGNTGGEKRHKLTEPELPTVTIPNIPNLDDDVDRGTNTSKFSIDSISSRQFGGDQPHENRPPYMVLAFVQRI